MIKQKILLKRLALGLLSVLLMFVFFVPMSLSASALSFHGIDISDYDSIDAYFLDVKLHFNDIYVGMEQSPPALDFWARADGYALLMLNFPNIKVANDETGLQDTIFVITQTKLNFPAGITNNSFVPSARYGLLKTEYSISLSNNYYKYLEKLSDSARDFTGFSVTVIYDNKGYECMSGSWMGKDFIADFALRTSQVPPTIVDPDSDDFDFNFGNTGDNTVPPTADGQTNSDSGLLGWLLKFIADLFGVSIDTARIIMSVFVIVVVASIFLPPIIKAFN